MLPIRSTRGGGGSSGGSSLRTLNCVVKMSARADRAVGRSICAVIFPFV